MTTYFKWEYVVERRTYKDPNDKDLDRWESIGSYDTTEEAIRHADQTGIGFTRVRQFKVSIMQEPIKAIVLPYTPPDSTNVPLVAFFCPECKTQPKIQATHKSSPICPGCNKAMFEGTPTYTDFG